MKVFKVALVLLLSVAYGGAVTDNCGGEGLEQLAFPAQVCKVPACQRAIQNHIVNEWRASLFYMKEAYCWGRIDCNRPGLASFFWDGANEERDHVSQFYKIMDVRGIPVDCPTGSFNLFPTTGCECGSMKAAIKRAIVEELKVTKMIEEIVDACSRDSHTQDKIIEQLLDEQYRGTRTLQCLYLKSKNYEAITTETAVGEFLYDRDFATGKILQECTS